MSFQSILFDTNESPVPELATGMPGFFPDLNLDQVVEVITAKKKDYQLAPFFYTPLKNNQTIDYRHAVMQELGNSVLFGNVQAFASGMVTVRGFLTRAGKAYYELQAQRWFLDAVQVYCETVLKLKEDLYQAQLSSQGFIGFRNYLRDYVNSEQFTRLLRATKTLEEDLAAVRYTLIIKGTTIKVRKLEPAGDYSEEVIQTFEKFKQGAVKDYRVTLSDRPDMNHVEAKVLEMVAQLYPETFSSLATFCSEKLNFIDEVIGNFDREIQFYISYLEYMEAFKKIGLSFCYPEISTESKEILSRDGFDLALAHNLKRDNAVVVCNDFELKGKERIIVVSGPNQGGKTTFARAFGQLHYLASLGCPIPGRAAKLFLYDQLFTHFEKEETINNQSGKLQDDLVRIHEILEQATPNSLIIMNEIFTSTTLKDAVVLSKRIFKEIIDLDLLCVCVTFIDELSRLGEKTISMVSTVNPEDTNQRTFKIIRRDADGISYAISIVEKYHLTYQHLKERIKS